MKIIRSTVFVVIGMMALAGCQKAAVDTAAIEAHMKQTVKDWLGAYNAGDVDTIVAFYAADAIVMAPGVPAAVGSDAIRAVVSEGSAAAQAAGLTLMPLDNDTVGISASGDMAWHAGGYTVNDASGAVVDSGNYLEVQQNRDGQWLIVRDIWNSDRAPAPAADAAAPAAG